MPDEFEDFVQDFVATGETPSVERQAQVSERVGLVPEKIKTESFKDQLFNEIKAKRDTLTAAVVEAGPLAATGQFIPAGLVLAGTLAFPPETPAQARGQVTAGIADLIASRALPGAGAARAAGRALLPGIATAVEQAGEVQAGQATPGQATATTAFTGLLPSAGGEAVSQGLNKLLGGGRVEPTLQRVRERLGSNERFGAAVETGQRGLRGLSRFSGAFDLTNQKVSSDIRLHNLATETIEKYGLEFEPGPEGMRGMREGVLGRINKARDFGEKTPSGEKIKRQVMGGDIVAVNESTGNIMTMNKGGAAPPGYKLTTFDQLGLDQMRQVLRKDPGVIARQIGPKDQNFFAVKELKKSATPREWEIFRKQWASEHILRTSLIDSALDVPSGIRARIPDERIVIDAKKLQKNIKETVGTQMAKEILGDEATVALQDVGDLLVRNSVDLTGKAPDPIPQFVSYGFNKVAFASTIGGAAGLATGATVPMGVGVVVGVGALMSYLVDNPKAAKLITEAAAGNKGALDAITRTLTTSDYFLPTGPPSSEGIVELEESPRGLEGPAARLRDQKGKFRPRSIIDVMRNR